MGWITNHLYVLEQLAIANCHLKGKSMALLYRFWHKSSSKKITDNIKIEACLGEKGIIECFAV